MLLTHGTNQFAQLGLGSKTQLRKNPTVVKTLKDCGIKMVACGTQHNAAVDADDRIWTWGSNDEGALGRPTRRDTEDEHTPSLVKGLPSCRVRAVSCGDSHTIVLLNNGEMWGFGVFRNASNNKGNMGFIQKGRDKKELSPVKIPGFEGKKIISVASGNDHCLALEETGRVWQWGDACTSTKGNNIADIEEKLHPSHVPLPADTKLIFAGACCSFAVLGDGSVYGWGLDNYGQLGVESQPRDPYADQWVYPPRMVECDFGGSAMRKICSAERHTLFLLSNGRIFACGSHHEGRLGIRNLKEDIRVPQEISEPDTGEPRLPNRYVDIAIGQMHSAALTSSGEAFAWGCGDDYQLGTGTDEEKWVPTKLLGAHLRGA